MSQIIKRLFVFYMLAISTAVYATDIANCHSPKGHIFYPQKGVVQKKDSGWQTDEISGGKFILTMESNDRFDLLFSDATNIVTSTIAAGGQVIRLRSNPDDLAIFIAYRDAIELFNFWKTADNKLQFSMLQNKGSGSNISKSGVMIGQCDFIKFDSIK